MVKSLSTQNLWKKIYPRTNHLLYIKSSLNCIHQVSGNLILNQWCFFLNSSIANAQTLLSMVSMHCFADLLYCFGVPLGSADPRLKANGITVNNEV